MKVIIQGQGETSLTQKEFLAAGGEGQVYVRGSTAFKVYTDPTRMLPVGKITELSAIGCLAVIKPEHVLLDPKKNTPVGYTMRFVNDAMPLCQTFTRAFREREGLDHPKMLTLVRKLQTLVEQVHKAGVLIVDLNEMNFLVNKAFTEVYGIDVDSYQTAHYPATAIMPSVKDWTVQGHDFTEGSDWFSFACVAYQMFCGIHPYKGKHPTVHGLDERMQAGISVFDPSVAVPKVVYPMDVIPPGYRAWFKAVLQDGKRLPPPADPGTFIAAAIVARAVASGLSLDISEVATYPEALLGYVESGGQSVVGMPGGVWLGKQPVRGHTPVRAVGWSPKNNHAVLAWVEGGRLHLYDATAQADTQLPLLTDAVMGCGGRIYVKSKEQVIEVVLTDIGSGVMASPRVAVNVLEHASHLHDGVVVQNLLGSVFVSVFPRAGASYQVRVPDLDTYKVIEAKCDGRVLMVVGADRKSGKYDRISFVLSDDFTTIAVKEVVRDVTPAGLNFVVLDNGTCVHLTEEEKLEVWNVAAPSRVRIVDDSVLGNDMRLVKVAGRVGFIRGDKVFSMRLK